MSSSPKLMDQVRDIIRLKHYSLETEKSYVHWIKRYILFHGKQHPKDMNAEHIRDYLTYLATDQRVAASTQNQALNAIVQEKANRRISNKELRTDEVGCRPVDRLLHFEIGHS